MKVFFFMYGMFCESHHISGMMLDALVCLLQHNKATDLDINVNILLLLSYGKKGKQISGWVKSVYGTEKNNFSDLLSV